MSLTLRVSVRTDVLELNDPDGFVLVPTAVEVLPLPPELFQGGVALVEGVLVGHVAEPLPVQAVHLYPFWQVAEEVDPDAVGPAGPDCGP